MHLLRGESVVESPEPSVTPGLPEQQPTHPRPSRGPSARLLIAVAVALLVAVAFLASLRERHTGSFGHALPATVVAPGTLRLKGTTEAVRASAILTPLLAGQQVGTLTITRLKTAGSQVKRGDLLVEFDRQAQVKDYLDKQAESNKLLSQVTEEQAKQDVARAKDETELRQAESNLKKAELEMQRVELLSAIDAEKAKQSLAEAKATLAQLRETYELKRQAAHAAIRILEIQRDRAQQTMLHAQKNADLMQIRSALDGIVVLDSIWKGGGRTGAVQEGDQVRPGEAFMHVVDPSIMQVRVFANQEDLLNLRVGRQANVRLDAYPDLVFAARLEQIAPVASTASFNTKIRLFTVIFSVLRSAPQLMPDLSAAVDVDLEPNASKSGNP